MSINDNEVISTKFPTVTYTQHHVNLADVDVRRTGGAPAPDHPEFEEYLKQTSAMAVQCGLEQGIYVPKSLLQEIAEKLNIKITASYGVVLPSGARDGVPAHYNTNVGYFHLAVPAGANNDKLWVVMAFKFLDGWTFVSRGYGIGGQPCTARRFIQLLTMLDTSINNQVSIPGMTFHAGYRPGEIPAYGAHHGPRSMFTPYGLGRYLDNFEHHAPYGRFGEGYAPAEDVKR